MLEETKRTQKIAVIDYYATWCPHCNRAAPMFSQLSMDYQDSNVIFCKVDVDKAISIASSNGVKAMPTFQVVSMAKEVGRMQGWGEAQLMEMIEQCGGVKPGPDHSWKALKKMTDEQQQAEEEKKNTDTKKK